MMMPSRFDAVAPQIAAGTLPRAMEVKPIEDCTVEESVQTNSTPIHSCGVSRSGTALFKARPSSGNRMKVEASVSRCRRGCFSPDRAASRESLAPCRKNSSEMAALLAMCMKCSKLPVAGKKVASSTVPMSNWVKRSGRKRFMARSRKK